MAMEYLYRRGHHRIGVVSRDTNVKKSIFDLRMQGILKYVEEHPDIEVIDSLIHATRTGVDEVFASRATKELLDARKDLTAIFAFTDVLALGVLTELQQRGIRVPEDISLCGVDNRDFAGLMNPPLTTLEEPAEQVALRALDVLLLQIDEGRQMEDVFLPPVLVERSSVQCNQE
jgi:DNA-binding LacI/PurR family transcriptional regulator